MAGSPFESSGVEEKHGDVVEMELGGQGSGAELVTTEEGLSNLLREGTEALRELRRKRHG
ncbi:hypothetical protein CDG81_04020 [Actinopolyspora erythraea]|uniref:Uncharacterized protein n=1 Tax=Actinopolyspora erythraea TaxID=414996 RepID=A0A099D324_9ACTN|nr:hypothetical protein [Actinopolyspora erythraea]ASU77617.1 hypothetical protein CDG81_04020 [Actinopolyspora erythraea]KGI80548.1 hypothetical protein IL38_16925 [Actinopolyspora erythraea]